jgi:EAL domain-containing protein (putative c-di-GMP-specific phosphodiesterase class I)
VAVKAHIDVIFTSVYRDQEGCDEVYDMMNYMATHNEATRETTLHFLNEEIIARKQRYNTIEAILREALETDGFTIVYQPIFHADTRQFLSAEALVRLADTETVGFISPEEFIPIAEKKGMIMELGAIVFEKVCAFARKEALTERGIQYIEVNLSGIQCVHPDLPTQLRDIMKKYAIAPGFINLEITETALVESGELLQENMNRLRSMGCSFSMDDFGTGYSNLSRMSEVVYDLVKLDKSLIWPCFSDDNHKANAILKSVIKMLCELKVNIVAEGVETAEMAHYLNVHGVTRLQGYYYSKPIAEDAYVSFLDEADIKSAKAISIC